MSNRINTNLDAINAQRNLGITANSYSKSVEKLSSGLRINRAADDAAGLSISEQLRAQVKGTDQAVRNAQDGISMIQTGEGALNETHSILQRMRELTVQAGNDTMSTDDRAAIAAEIGTLTTEIDRISSTTKFNGKTLLDGNFGGAAKPDATLLIGGNSGETMTVTFDKMDATTLTVNALDVTDSAKAQASIDKIDVAIKAVSTQRSALGASQNRLEHTIANLNVASENLSASESRIRDLDVAAEMVKFTKTQVLQQAGTAILAQANQSGQGVLSLLR
jgi:flagellin